MSPGRSNLLLDQIEVIEEPFSGGGDSVFRLDRVRQELAGFDEEVLIVGQPPEQSIVRAFRAQLMGAGKRFAVLLHLLGAEQFRAQRWLVAGKFMRQTANLNTIAQMDKSL